MRAIACSFCDAVASPSTMRWGGVDGDVDDEGQMVGINGPICEKCARGHYAMNEGMAPIPYCAVPTFDSSYPTMIDADEAPAPEDDDLDEWISTEGRHLPEFVKASEATIESMIEAGEIRVSETWVPYGSTTVSLGTEYDWDDVPESALRAVAFGWWEEARLTWSHDLGPTQKDGHRHFWLVLDDNNDEGETST